MAKKTGEANTSRVEGKYWRREQICKAPHLLHLLTRLRFRQLWRMYLQPTGWWSSLKCHRPGLEDQRTATRMPVYLARKWTLLHWQLPWRIKKTGPLGPGQETPASAFVISLQCPLLTRLRIAPADKEDLSIGSSSFHEAGQRRVDWASLVVQWLRICLPGFPGDAVVENLPANAGDTGSGPGLGGSHMPRSN